jgi:cardiolipin synthase
MSATAKWFTLFVEGDDLYDAMLADLAKARKVVRLESYIFEDDEVGARFIQALCDVATAGVETTLRLDAAGSMRGLHSASLGLLREAGVRLEWSRAWSWRNPWAFHLRNHRKVLVVDEDVAYLGGFNIHRDSSRRVVGDTRWRDTHVRVVGALVDEAIAAFELPRGPDGAWKRRRGSPAYLLPNRTAKCRHRLRCAFLDGLGSARRRAWLTTPYFVPDRKSRRLLALLARRGVDVRLLLPGRSDVPLAQWAGHAVYAPMLAAGVRIFEYGGRVLHAKTAVADDGWATVGSANFDYRSFFVNDEINLVADDPDFVTAIALQFERDQAASVEILEASWRRRRMTAPVAEAVGWWARRWL